MLDACRTSPSVVLWTHPPSPTPAACLMILRVADRCCKRLSFFHIFFVPKGVLIAASCVKVGVFLKHTRQQQRRQQYSAGHDDKMIRAA